MKNLLFLIASLALVAGCASSSDVNVAPTTEAKPVAVDQDPAKAALIPTMSHIAEGSTGTWATLTSEQKAPFLTFHDQNEANARKHYETMVLNIKEDAGR